MQNPKASAGPCQCYIAARQQLHLHLAFYLLTPGSDPDSDLLVGLPGLLSDMPHHSRLAVQALDHHCLSPSHEPNVHLHILLLLGQPQLPPAVALSSPSLTE